MLKIPVTFICPQCGIKWTEEQDPDDYWFGLGTNQTLCPTCGAKAMKKARQQWKEWKEKHENLSGWTSSN